MCNYWKKTPESLVEPSLEDFRIGSIKLSSLGSIFVSLAGGEPLLRRDIVDVVDIVSRHHLTFITTNGYLLDRHMAQELFRAGLWGVSVSIDYADPARHDDTRGVPGAFDRAVAALEYLVEARLSRNQRVNLMITLMEDNLGEVESLLELAARLDVNVMVQPYSSEKTGDPLRMPPAGSGRKLVELRRRYPNFLSNQVFLEKFDRFIAGGVPNCRAGKSFFNIDTYMNVAICVEDRTRPVANLRTSSAHQILRALRRRARDNKCKSCWYNCRGEVEVLSTVRGMMHALPAYLLDGFRNPSASRRSPGPHIS